MKKTLLLLLLACLTVQFTLAQVSPIFRYNNRTRVDTSARSRAIRTLAKFVSNIKDTAMIANAKDYKNEHLRKAFLATGNNISADSSFKHIRDTAEIILNDEMPTSAKDRDSLLNVYRDSLSNARNDDDSTLARINNKIHAIKLYNTNEFLSKEKKPIPPFKITEAGRYDLDTLNNYLYNQASVSALQNAALQNFNNDNTNITAEFASALFGPVRMGLSGTFSTKGDTTKDNAIKTSLQKIITNGGEFNLNFLVPLLNCRDRSDQVHFGIFFQSNSGINPGINDSTGNTNFSSNVLFTNQTGLLLHTDFGSNDKKTRISIDLPFYYAWGS